MKLLIEISSKGGKNGGIVEIKKTKLIYQDDSQA